MESHSMLKNHHFLEVGIRPFRFFRLHFLRVLCASVFSLFAFENSVEDQARALP
jgi:hypothetical protein